MPIPANADASAGTSRPRRVRAAALAAALLLGTAPRAGAQIVVGGGFRPGYGYGYGYGYGIGLPVFGGPFVGIGMSPFDQQMYREQSYANEAARYNLQNAQAAQAYQAANLSQQQAVATELANVARMKALQERYGPQPANSNAGPAPAPTPAGRPMAIEKLIAPDGTVLWPKVIPAAYDRPARRQAAEEAIAAAFEQARRRGRASVRSVNDAREKLSAYAGPILGKLRARAAVDELRTFVLSLDEALAGLAELPPPAKPR